MKTFWSKILVGLVTAAIISNTALLLNLRDRMTRLETKLEFVLSVKNSTAHNQ